MLKNFLRSKEHCKYWLANVTLESFENWILCLARSRFHLSFVGLLKKTLQMAKKLVKMIRCRFVCYHIYRRNRSFFLGKTSRISAGRFSLS